MRPPSVSLKKTDSLISFQMGVLFCRSNLVGKCSNWDEVGTECPTEWPAQRRCDNAEPRGRGDLSALPALSQAGGLDQVDAEAAARITVAASYWASGATCLSGSRSLGAPAVARDSAKHSL